MKSGGKRVTLEGQLVVSGDPLQKGQRASRQEQRQLMEGPATSGCLGRSFGDEN